MRRVILKDVINHLFSLIKTEGKLPKIPSTKMNHFISDYLSDDKKRKRKDALKEWEILKKLPIPKTYQEWKKYCL